MADQLNLTAPEDPYILTPEEEERVLDNEAIRLKHHMAWKMGNLRLPHDEIEHRLSQIDFRGQVNRERLLSNANYSKSYNLRQEKQRIQERLDKVNKQKELAEFWTAGRMFGLMKHTAYQLLNTSGEELKRELIVNDQTTPLIKTICFFFSRDPRFESELGYSFQKGLWVRGVSGLGKTFLVDCVAQNELNPAKVISMIEITDSVKGEGAYEIEEGNHRILYLDDVGTEETPVNYYGTKINWFKDFLELYYAKKRPFASLIISTNINFSEVESKYGFRVRSRVKDMFNVVDVTGKDLRGL